MATIILDTSSYKARTGRVPPKKGAVKASFQVGPQLALVEGATFAAAVNEAKKTARSLGVTTIVLDSVFPQ